MTNPQQIGPYKVLWRLGRGGMGAVYLCQHRDLGFRRAIKVLHTDGSESALDRFKKEAQVQAELDHPHLLKIEHSDLDQDGRAYVVMAYIGDEAGPMDLDRYLKDHGGKLDSRTTARLVGQILDGLSYAHGEGIVHRDLKPANVLIEQTPSGPMARIADFGLVRIVGEAMFRDRIFTSISESLSLGSAPTIPGVAGAMDVKSGRDPSIGSAPTIDGQAGSDMPDEGGSPAGTSTQALIGTWSYMAPEQKKPGTAVDHRTDLYAVGLMAYRMLMGRLPEGITRLPGQEDAELSPWDAWISRALEADPSRRFQEAAEARSGLNAMAGRSPSRAGRWVGALAVVVVLAAVGLWAITGSWSGTQDSLPPTPVVSIDAEAPNEEQDEQPAAAHKYSSASDLIEPAARIKSLQQTELSFPEHAAIKEKWREAASYVEIATENRSIAEWNAAGVAFENARRMFEDTIALDQEAASADVARTRFAERTADVDWFEHPIVNAGYAEADDRAAQARQAWEAGSFDDADAAWGQAEDLARSAIEKSDAARAADVVRREWNRRVSSLPEPLYDEVRPAVHKLVASSAQMEADFAAGRFVEAESAWVKSTSQLGELLSNHEGAQGQAAAARDSADEARMTALAADVEKDAASEWSAAEADRREAEGHFETGDFPGSAELWGSAKRGYATSVTTAYDNRFAAHLASAAACRDWDCSAAALSRIAAALVIKPGNTQALAERGRLESLESPQQRAARERRERIAGLLRDARANDSKANGKVALRALEALLALEPSHAEALRLKEKIEGYYGPDPTLTLDLGGGVTMELVLIESGEFLMGSPSSEAKRDDDEGPQHRVRISKPFYMGKHEVTQAQWRAVMGSNPSHFKGDSRPVESVSWNEIQEFCRKLSARTGRTIRLPTEAEWEYSCRAGTTSSYSFGDSSGGLGDHAWYTGNSGKQTHSVGAKQPNGWGLHDMHGNVWEWCGDWYGEDYYASSPGTNPTGPGSGKYRVLRGGSWYLDARNCRCAYRLRVRPDLRYNDYGFRVVAGTLPFSP